MFRSLDEVRGVYEEALATLNAFIQSVLDHQERELQRLGYGGIPLKNPSVWNSTEQFIFREKETYLRGAEDALGLTQEEIDEGRSAADVPPRVRSARRTRS